MTTSLPSSLSSTTPTHNQDDKDHTTSTSDNKGGRSSTTTTTTVTTTPPNTNTNTSIFVKPNCCRLVTIVAHVDHGKTTLADNLIEYNGFISTRLMGTIRYLDSDPEEQRRGITMRTSAIALKYQYNPTNHNPTTTKKTTIATSSNGGGNGSGSGNGNNNKSSQDMIIHVLDSPGHTDFSMEVTSAVTACDNALIVIDCIEGISPRTQQIIRETYQHQLIPILIINKIDKLYTELHLHPNEAYLKLRTLIESVNATAASIINSARTTDTTTTTSTTTTSDPNEQTTNKNDEVGEDDQQKHQQKQQQQQQEKFIQEEQLWTFDPTRYNNVIFCSALFGWGFTIQSLARSLYRSNIIPIKPMILKSYLFGDYKLIMNQQQQQQQPAVVPKIVKWKHSSSTTTTNTTTTHDSSSITDDNHMSLFAQYGLQPIWSIYEGIGIAIMTASSSFSLTTKKKDSKITSDTYGMEQVLDALQVGCTMQYEKDKIRNVQDLQIFLSRSGSISSSSSSNINNTGTGSTNNGMSTSTSISSGGNEEILLRTLLHRYRPLSNCLLDTICDYCPSPQQAVQTYRSDVLTLQKYPPPLPPTTSTSSLSSSSLSPIPSAPVSIMNHVEKGNEKEDGVLHDPLTNAMNEFRRIQHDVSICNTAPDAVTVAHICKFLVTDLMHIRDTGLKDVLLNEYQQPDNSSSGSTMNNNEEGSSSNILLGVARVLSGCLRTGDSYYFMGPNYNPYDRQYRPHLPIRLYLLMGSSFVHVPTVPAGHICAIYYQQEPNQQHEKYENENKESTNDNDNNGDENDLQFFKTVTLCDNPFGMPVRNMEHRLRPLVKVTVEPVRTSDWPMFERALHKLALADSAIEITTTMKGERTIACLGEIHLEQSLLELEKYYSGGGGGGKDEKVIPLRVSDPIIDFAETTTWFDNETDDYNTFFFGGVQPPPLRQVTIPPYNEEEGIQFARLGRTRAVLSGRCAAIGVRVLPLHKLVHEALQQLQYQHQKQQGKDTIHVVDLDDETAEELKKLGKALHCDINGCTPIQILQHMLRGMCSIDNNGNVLIESTGIRNGTFIRGVDAEEIFVPTILNVGSAGGSSTVTAAAVNGTNEKGMNKGDDIMYDNDMTTNISNVHLESKKVYDTLSGMMQQMCVLNDSKDIDNITTTTSSIGDDAANLAAREIWDTEMKGSVVAGFQLAMRAGPVCEEPMHNTLAILEYVEVAVTAVITSNHQVSASKTTIENVEDTSTIQTARHNYHASKPLSGGMVVAAIRSGIRCAFLSRPIRLMEGQLRLTLHSSLNGLGSLYSVLSKRRGKVISDSMVDGTNLLHITAIIPQAEAFGLAPELYRKTSGEVTAPEMLFSHWSCLDGDPFWIPTSEVEREDYGEIQRAGDSSTGLDTNTLALMYIRSIRTRKGLMIDAKRTVLSAEKQRTLKR